MMHAPSSQRFEFARPDASHASWCVPRILPCRTRPIAPACAVFPVFRIAPVAAGRSAARVLASRGQAVPRDANP
jgi:hypothetical protein